MRGSPLLRALIAFLAILLLGYPLRKVTGTGDASAPRPEATPTPLNRSVSLQLTFTAIPKSFVVEHLGKVIWQESAPQAEMERTVPLAYPKEGVELHFAASYEDAQQPVAARIRLTDPDGEAHERSLWGRGTIDEIAAFP